MALPTSSPRTSDQKPVRADSLLLAIAQHLCPDPPSGAGLPCVKGKRNFLSLADESKPDRGLYSNTEDLTLSDRGILQQFLDRHADILPPLRQDMSAADVENFLLQFRSIAGRPMEWEPHVYSKDDRSNIARTRLDLYTKHTARLQKEVEQGKVRLFDGDRIPHDALHVPGQSFLTRGDAQAYLGRVGVPVGGVLGDELIGERHQEPMDATRITERAQVSSQRKTEASGQDRLLQEKGPLPNVVAEADAPTSSSATAPDASTPLAESVAAPAGSGRTKRKWTVSDKELVVLLYQKGRSEDGAAFLGIDKKKFNQYAERWQEQHGVGDKKADSPHHTLSTAMRPGHKLPYNQL